MECLDIPSLLMMIIIITVITGFLPKIIFPSKLSQINRFPLGVCAGITPFNFPAMVPLWMFPYATVCGNSYILKPSERVPLTSVRLMELAKDCGLPDGVCNMIHGKIFRDYVSEEVVKSFKESS